MKRLIYLFILLPLFCSCGRVAEVKIAFDASISDYTPIVREIIEAHPQGNLHLSFEEGTYNFYPEEARQMYLAVSNNDNGDKKVAFPFIGAENVTVEGSGTGFLFHGSMVPFVMKDCRGMAVRGISIDYDHPFVLEGEVVANEASSFTIRVHEDNLYEVRDGQLYLKGYDWELPMGENIVFDSKTLSPYHSAENYEWNQAVMPSAEDLGSRLVKLSGVQARMMPPVGSIYTDKGPHSRNRLYPGFAVQGCEGIALEDVTVHCSGAMALIAERSEDISCLRYDVCVPEGSGRVLAASADATHFVGCAGKIDLIDCCLESMLDDATNVHDTYMKVDSVLTEGRFLASFGHFQQEGYDFAAVGERIRFVGRKGLVVIGEGLVKDIRVLNENCYEIVSDFDLRPYEGQALAVENIDYTPSVTIRSCTVRKNRARSLLLSAAGDFLVENCDFASMMAGIRICGDANYWFESGRTSNIVIRNNVFRNLGNGGWNPQAVLQIDPVLADRNGLGDEFYHSNIVFEGNTVYSDESQLIYALSVGSLRICGNRFITTGQYDARYPGLATIDLQRCGNVIISDNDLSSWRQEAQLSVHDCKGINLNNDAAVLPVVDNPNKYFYEN